MVLPDQALDRGGAEHPLGLVVREVQFWMQHECKEVQVRGKIVTLGGMEMFSTLMTCMLTWKRRGMDVTTELVRRLGEN